MTPLELRLYVAALLAAIYTISWRAIGGHGPATAPPIALAPPQPQRLVWIDHLPAEALALPPGWQIASVPHATVAPTERVTRVPTRRAPRVRTRSS